jgi:hypothetical protein
MKHIYLCRAATSVFLIATSTTALAAPFDGGSFRGRIAYSADGNHNDKDDWAASPVALAILAECGVKDRLVHFDYNCILPKTDPEWEKIHAASVLGAAEKYGYDLSVFRDCRKELDAAVASITKAINDSTADDPLYFIVAGPMEVPFLGIRKSDPEKRKFVYCISHSRWNDGFASDYTFTHTKRSVISLGVHWIQIRDQNRLLSNSPYGRPAKADEWQPWMWMRDSDNPRVRFLWERMQVSTRPDPSDAGMAYFLVTGDETADPMKLRQLLNDKVVPRPVHVRTQIRLEAENFLELKGFQLEDRNDRTASHRLSVKSAGDGEASIRTRFAEPYAAPSGRYDIEVRYFADPKERCQFTLQVNGTAHGQRWDSVTDEGWTTHTIRGIEIRTGDEIAVLVSNGRTRLDYVEVKGLESRVEGQKKVEGLESRVEGQKDPPLLALDP